MEVDPEYKAAEEGDGDVTFEDGEFEGQQIDVDDAPGAPDAEVYDEDVEYEEEGAGEGEENDAEMEAEADAEAEAEAEAEVEVEIDDAADAADDDVEFAGETPAAMAATDSGTPPDTGAPAGDEQNAGLVEAPHTDAGADADAVEGESPEDHEDHEDHDAYDEHEHDELEPPAPITVTTPSGKLYALFQNDAEGGADLPVLCADKEEEFVNLSLLDLFYELRLELEKWGEELDGEMLVVERLMDLRMGEVSPFSSPQLPNAPRS